MRPEVIHELRSSGGAVRRSQLPGAHYDHLVRTGQLVPILHGVAVTPDDVHSTVARAAAAMLAHPNTVVAGRAAAALTWWPELDRADLPIDLDRPSSSNPGGVGLSWRRRATPPELVTQLGPLRVAAPALSAVTLIPEIGGRAVDEALRRRATTLRDMWRALELTPGRHGNPVRRTILHDSRDEPWSEAERLAHSVLRQGRITGWRANLRVRLHQLALHPKQLAYLDVGFAALRLGLEIDGRTHHSTATDLHHDRTRDLALTLEGWQIIRFPAGAVADSGWLGTVRRLMRRRATDLGIAPPAACR